MITSTQNPKIKEFLRLSKGRERKITGLFIIEGYREIKRAFENGYRLEKLFICPELNVPDFSHIINNRPEIQTFEVNKHVYSRIAYRDNSDGIIAVAGQRSFSFNDIPENKQGLYLVLESVEKPGNLGAILRTADAANVDAVFICNNQTDIYNPNIIRASLGCLFSKKIIQSSTKETIDFFKKRKINIFASALQDSVHYYNADMRPPSAIIMGSEARGLSEEWRKAANKIIKIPMKGIADSLNVSVSAAVLVFEALRQRDGKSPD